LDEYVVVADLYLRRGRSSGGREPEVLRLAQLTGRTPASISYRIGNYHGTAHPGAGLKPVTGEALAIFTAMAASETERHRLTAEAMRRLSGGLPPAPIQLPTAAARLAEPEQTHTAETEAMLAARAHTITRAETQLVQRYLKWIDATGTRFKSVLIPTDAATLRTDLYDPTRDLLIEAKAHSSREYIRYAIGQPLDYRRRIDPRPRSLAASPSCLRTNPPQTCSACLQNSASARSGKTTSSSSNSRPQRPPRTGWRPPSSGQGR